ncbi:MAG TPA: hypothetical protein VHA52_11930 [Candidatus Babeliaceae bacterium]|nr:hypothetical protein [Candidatus Babeliaceae bacterium]
MNQCVCTIITFDYLSYSFTLFDSLRSHYPGVELKVLIVDGVIEPISVLPLGVEVFTTSDLCKSGIGLKIKNKYFHGSRDRFRWSMKPVFINYLIRECKYDKILYADSDLFFFAPFEFLFDELNLAGVLLSPHYRCSTPFRPETLMKERENFELLFNNGIYNGGFLGVSRAGCEAMDWWAKACEYICIKDEGRGFCDDQTHLNLIPVLFENAVILRHKGCNIANWNQSDCKRTKSVSGQITINDEWEIVFVHFTRSTICGILSGEDPLLADYLELYSRAIKLHRPDFDLRYYRLTMGKEGQNDDKLINKILRKIRSNKSSSR